MLLTASFGYDQRNDKFTNTVVKRRCVSLCPHRQLTLSSRETEVHRWLPLLQYIYLQSRSGRNTKIILPKS